MKPKIYLETTIPRYLTAWPSRDLIIAAHQQITQQWWQTRSAEFELFVSQIVLSEAGAGDKDSAARRLAVLENLPVLEQTEAVTAFAQELMEQVPFPEKAAIDALHVAMAVVNGMDYMLTWNCTHIAKAALRGRIEAICRANGYDPPVICIPEELLEG